MRSLHSMTATIDTLDRLFSLGAGRQRFFADGWGDRALLDALSVEGCTSGSPADVEVRVQHVRRRTGCVETTASFESPEHRLPSEARTARILQLSPLAQPRGTVLLLAASGDQGFAMRRRFAAGLVERGIAAVLLENPYYGTRRPRGQRGAAVRTVADMALMATATVREARALLPWLARETRGPVGVSGYSMGGQMAAMTGASMPFPVACVPLAPSSTPASVFTEGLLRRVVDVDALALGDPSRAMEELRQLFLRFDVCALPPPVCREAAIVVGGARDGIVPPAEPERIARHWGAELRWLPTGHVGAVLRHGSEMRAAIEAAIDRRVSTSFDARARTWDEDASKRERAEAVAAAIAARTPVDGKRVLDYGAGTGLLGLALRPRAAEVTLVDVSGEMLAVASEKIAAARLENVRTLHLDLTVDSPPELRVDLVCTLMAMHHLPDTGRVLRAFHALLAPGGVVCIADLDREDGSFHGAGFTGHRGFLRDELRAVLEASGFRDVHFETVIEIAKKRPEGPHSYPVFLATARRD